MSFPKENDSQSMIKEFGDFIRHTDYKEGDISDKIKTKALNIPLDSIYQGKISPLILTIYYNYCNVFNILLSRGFDINASDDMFNNMNPLMWAIEKNNEYMIESSDKESVGITFNQGDEKQLAYAIKYAVKNLDKINYLGINARKKAIDNYQWNRLTKLILTKVIQKNNFK